MSTKESLWVRTCQECGHEQTAKEPVGEPTDSYRNSKCRRCRSEALDFGQGGYERVDGKLRRIDNESLDSD